MASEDTQPEAAAAAVEGASLDLASLVAQGRVLAARQLLLSVETEQDARLAAEVASACEEVDTALEALRRPRGTAGRWALALDDELLTYYRPPDREDAAQRTIHGVWFRGALPAATRAVVAVAREFDLVQYFAGTFLFDTRVLAVESLLEVTVYAALYVPVLADRDFAVSVRGYDLLDEHGCVVIVFADSPPSYDHLLPPESASRVRLHFRRACIKLQPHADGATVATLCAHVDPCMPGDLDVPQWLVTWAIRILAPFLFARAKDVAAQVCIHKEYTARMASNTELYGLIERRETLARASTSGIQRADSPDGAPHAGHEEETEQQQQQHSGMFARLTAAWRTQTL
jgi:hypothetical protein